MGKLISNIRNYPLSRGAVAYDNRTLLDNDYRIQDHTREDYFSMLLEFSKDIYFFNDAGSQAYRWNNLIGRDSVFQYARFLTIRAQEFHQFFIDLPQSNHFLSDVELTEDEYEVLAWQRFQLIHFLFTFYRNIDQTIIDEKSGQVKSILKSDPVSRFFVAFKALVDECISGNSPLVSLSNRKPVEDFKEINIPSLSEESLESLQIYYNPSSQSGSKVLEIYSNAFDKIKAANEYAHSIFSGLLQIHQTFHYWAYKRLRELTTTVNTHQPHIALLIAFCNLKSLFDARYNQLIESNTKFIYERILQIGREPVLGDRALVAIELAKNVDQHFIERNSLFKAGKNSLGKQVYYRSAEDLVANGAKITYLKSMTRVHQQGQLFSVMATTDAGNSEWQVNNAWLPFNDLSSSYTGMSFESKVLMAELKKDTVITFVFTFMNDVPEVETLNDRFDISVLLKDGSSIPLAVDSVTISGNQLSLEAKLEKDLKEGKDGINTRIKIISPIKDEAEDESYAMLYGFLLRELLVSIVVKLANHSFVPAAINSSSGLIEGSGGFMAFGSQSLHGSSFRIIHPLLEHVNNMTLSIEWNEALKENFTVQIKGVDRSFTANSTSSMVSDLSHNNESLKIQLGSDVTYLITATVKRGAVTSTIETRVPRVLMVKEVRMTADIEEKIYTHELRPLKRRELINLRPLFLRTLRMPFSNKRRQKKEILKRHILIRRRLFRDRHNNQMAYVYPLGELEIEKNTGLTFLPDYSVLGFKDYVADLYIGLSAITPGQSISLLFDIADETAGQSEEEAKISWWCISQNGFIEIDPNRVTDTTNHFLQSGLVRMTLPEISTNSNSIVEGNNIHWIAARCDHNYEVVANIRGIKTNGLEVSRVFDDTNEEAKVSVPPATIENIFPKTANIKSVTQSSPSSSGREAETDRHFFWRVSQRLRHKQRAIHQWDFEQLVLENFSHIYKVKCLNHAYYDMDTEQVQAKAAHTVISLIPRFIINPDEANFQPAIPLSRLLAIREFLLSKATAFNQLQILNNQWDEISVVLEVVLERNVFDLVFYRDKLNLDIKRYLSPWAFEQVASPALASTLYLTSLVDYVDELPYVHHIRSMHVLKNNVEIFDEIISSSEIHLLTSALEHTITVIEYGK